MGSGVTVRVVETEQDRQMLVKFIGLQELPFTATVVKGKQRTDKQNRLGRHWIAEIAAQLPDHPAEYWRGYCKLHFGVPILRNENEEFCEVYDRLIRPLDYEKKIEMMMIPIDVAVTRIMTTKQKASYLDAIHAQFTSLGIELTDPMGWR